MKEKNTHGVTLIALVVTIVILLILVAVSMSVLLGNNGIIKQADYAKTQTDIGRYKEEIELIAVGEQTDYITKKIDFESMVDNVKIKIEEKDYVETVNRKDGTRNTVLEVQTDLNKMSVVLSDNGIEVVEGEVEIPQVADASIFNYRENDEGKIEIIGFNLDNMEIEETALDGTIYEGELRIYRFTSKKSAYISYS